MEGGSRATRSSPGQEASMRHMQTEKRRRDRIAVGFEALRELIPCKDRKMDKATFLQQVVDYVGQLQSTMQEVVANGGLSTLPEESQWQVRLLLPRHQGGAGPSSNAPLNTQPSTQSLPNMSQAAGQASPAEADSPAEAESSADASFADPVLGSDQAADERRASPGRNLAVAPLAAIGNSPVAVCPTQAGTSTSKAKEQDEESGPSRHDQLTGRPSAAARAGEDQAYRAPNLPKLRDRRGKYETRTSPCDRQIDDRSEDAVGPSNPGSQSRVPQLQALLQQLQAQQKVTAQQLQVQQAALMQNQMSNALRLQQFMQQGLQVGAGAGLSLDLLQQSSGLLNLNSSLGLSSSQMQSTGLQAEQHIPAYCAPQQASAEASGRHAPKPMRKNIKVRRHTTAARMLNPHSDPPFVGSRGSGNGRPDTSPTDSGEGQTSSE